MSARLGRVYCYIGSPSWLPLLHFPSPGSTSLSPSTLTSPCLTFPSASSPPHHAPRHPRDRPRRWIHPVPLSRGIGESTPPSETTSSIYMYVLTLNNAFATLLPGPTHPGSLHPLLQPTLNVFASLGNSASRAVRAWLRKLIEAGGLLYGSEPDSPRCWPPNAIWRLDTPGLQMHLPFNVGNVTNFYGTRHYASTHGEMFRGGNTRLHRNYLHNPVSYQGLSSSIIISGTPITRPPGSSPVGDTLARDLV